MENDLISRSALEAEFAGPFVQTYKECREALREAPAVDAVEIVRCKDCANRGDTDKCPMCDSNFEVTPEAGIEIRYTNNTEDDGFCHKGRKKDAVD